MSETTASGKWMPTESFGDIFRAELKTLLPDLELPPATEPQRAPGPPDDQAQVEPVPKLIADALDARAEDDDLAALCLSGGGIRSASFGLGVLQGLARCGWLGHFHYLSSVSGGGYIASWLSAWRCVEDDREVIAGLTSMDRDGVEPSQIRGIRANSNYITPDLGLFSADTWTVIAIYVRNLLLNWLLFLPFLTGCLLFPQWCVVALQAFKGSGSHHPGPWLLAACLALTFALSSAVCGRFKSHGQWLTKERFLLFVLAPIVLSAALFTIAAGLGGLHRALGGHPGDRDEQLVVGALAGAGLYFLAWLFGRVAAWRWEDRVIPGDLACWVLSGAIVGVVIAGGMHVSSGHSWHADRIAVLGLSGVVLAYIGGDIFYVGASSFSRRGEMDREWLARASAWLAASATIWGLGSALAVYGPGTFNSWVLSLGGTLSGIVTLSLGPSALTAATKAGTLLERIPLTRMVSIVAAVFAAVLGVLIASLGVVLMGRLAGCDPSSDVWKEPLIILALIVGAFLISFFVNVNRFSLHALYRNRLVRAFLGSARVPGNRAPDPFTRFDEMDNPRLARVAPRTGANRLYQVINTTLNVVSTNNTAWAQRKAESFTMTRKHCGNSFVGYQPTGTYGGPGGGITLGTAMAISGAAVSPNQGYNSSPLVGFLLMLFNVRLGWWLGNPGRRKCCNRDGPRLGITPALKELAGVTTDGGPWIYLSDGGHFDNLGLYEMVRRRCRFIVVIDAGCDPQCKLEDLSNAVRKIYIDFGVSIEFAKFGIRPRPNPQPCPQAGAPIAGARFATATITYPRTSAEGPEPRTGWLLYIKPTYYETTEGVDVRGYAAMHPSFPHESTTDQWFTESQLEAYRALAAHIVEEVCCRHNGGREATLRSLRNTVERHAESRATPEQHR